MVSPLGRLPVGRCSRRGWKRGRRRCRLIAAMVLQTTSFRLQASGARLQAQSAIWVAHTMRYGQYVYIMKTTLDIHDTLLQRAKRLAARTGRPLRAVVEDGLRLVLASEQDPSAYELSDCSVGSPLGSNPL